MPLQTGTSQSTESNRCMLKVAQGTLLNKGLSSTTFLSIRDATGQLELAWANPYKSQAHSAFVLAFHIPSSYEKWDLQLPSRTEHDENKTRALSCSCPKLQVQGVKGK